MLLCKKIKIEVSPQDAEALEFMQAKCRALYNWWVLRLREGERWNLYEAKQTLQASKQYDPELQQVYDKLLHESTSVSIRPCKPSSGVSKRERRPDSRASSRAISSSRSVIRPCT